MGDRRKRKSWVSLYHSCLLEFGAKQAWRHHTGKTPFFLHLSHTAAVPSMCFAKFMPSPHPSDLCQSYRLRGQVMCHGSTSRCFKTEEMETWPRGHGQQVQGHKTSKSSLLLGAQVLLIKQRKKINKTFFCSSPGITHRRVHGGHSEPEHK